MRWTMALKLAVVVAGVSGIGIGGIAQAANLLTNGSFEQPVLSTLSTNIAYYGHGNTSMTGWTVDMRSGATSPYVQLTNNSAFGGLSASDGIQFLDLTGIVGRSAGVLSNAVNTLTGYDYRVSFDVGAVFYNGSFGAATVDLQINGALVGSYTVQPPSNNSLNWQNVSYGFAGTGAPVRIGLYASASLASSDLGVGLDNVVLTETLTPPPPPPPAPGVPEPASWAMLIAGLGLSGAALRRRRAGLATG